MLNYQRMLNTFLELARVEAPSGAELPMQEAACQKLRALGCKVKVDNAGKTYKTNAKGNVIASMAGTVKSAPFILAAHLDSVNPCKGVRPVVKGSKVVAGGDTILAADDRAGIAIILEVLQTLKEQKIPHPPVEVLFTLCEEAGMFGAKALNPADFKGREGLILDNDENSQIIINAPEAATINITITGLAAHAGVEPQKGISALEVAAYAISIMKLGRIDPLTVANLGVINGGMSTNVVMPELKITGEARSRNLGALKKQLKHMEECFRKAEKKFTKKVDGKTAKPVIKFEVTQKYPILNIPPKSALIRHIQACGAKHGVKIATHSSGGGYDANVLYGKGLLTPIIGIGYRAVHTLKEWLDIKEFNKTADIVLEVVKSYKK